ncbi:insulinase family protein [bacterium]|nr:insulinase family protein [bacterium]MBU1073392.1 insulinase family protein [bacterium]MBU1676216.1 insulinase family protein [bacterium]
MPAFPKKLVSGLTGVVLLLAAGAAVGSPQDLQDQVQEFTLDNGIHFIVLERHDVPVFSFNTYMNVGSSDELTGHTGMAHILEHMAFKGTSEIGTTDIKKELKAMQAEDKAFAALLKERNRGDRADPDKLAELQSAFDAAVKAALEFVTPNEFGEIVENNGGRGMNAGTWTDDTNYFYSFPSNRLELWAYLEGTRMADPVLRQFYTEKHGPVLEERRMRTDNSPFGMLMEQFQNLAFMAHPYHHSTIGWMSDIQNATRADCQAFYDKHYVGKNMTVAIVGDVDFAEVKKLATKYFAGVSAAEPPVMDTFEPEQKGERRIVIEDEAQPFYMCGFHIGNYDEPDYAVYEAIADIIGQGRTSRLYGRLVKRDKIAAQVVSFAGFPSNKYPTLLAFLGIPAKDVTALEIEGAIFEEIQKLVDEGVTEEELAGVKRRAKANYVRSLQGNLGLARQLAAYQGLNGDWREMFTQLDDIEAVTVEDVQRVAKEIFVPNNRTVAYIETVEAE